MSETWFRLLSGERAVIQRVVEKGETLFSQGESVVYMYQVNRGSIKLTRNTIDGMPVVLHIAGAQETIADASLFSDTYHCTAIASVESEVEAVSKHEILEYIEGNPTVMKKMLASFSWQIRGLRAINEIKNIRSARERILAYLRSEMDAGNQVIVSTSMKDVAHKIGLAHETFYRELKKLEDAGTIYRENGNINIRA